MKTSKNILTLLTELLIVLISISIKASPGDIVGSWRTTNSCVYIFIQFNADGTFSADRNMDNTQSSISGTYSVQGNKIILVYAIGANDTRATSELNHYNVTAT